MLTLKVITTDQDGNQTSHLFSGDSITHREYFSTDHYIIPTTQKELPRVRFVGSMVETSSNQKFVASEVTIFDDDHCFKNELLILPKADCYIMENGKTVDTFFCQYER